MFSISDGSASSVYQAKKKLSKTSKIRISLMGSLTARIHQLSKTMQDTEKAK